MKELALYVHIPFCKMKCRYCDFPSFCGKEKLVKDYIKAIKIEINNLSKDYLFNTIFIGGGTPTFLNCEELEEILIEINKLKIKENCEFTVECNPGSVDEEKLKILKKYNVNRLSFGLQSIYDKYLKILGRIHNYEEFEENYNMARKIGFQNINIDLMFGIPEETIEEWEKTLNKIIELEPEHISAYSLIIEEGTPFYSLYEKDRLNLPSEDQERQMYSKTKEILSKHGYNQYEISNYSKEGKECKHNITYWRLDNYIGVGSSSASYIDGERFTNNPKLETYIEDILKSKKPIIEHHKNLKEEDIEEYMFLGLRMIDGIYINEFEKKFELKVEDLYKKVIDKFINEKLLKLENNRLFLTEKGVEVSNYVMSEFLLTT